MDISSLYQIYLKHPQVFTDTRKPIKNGLFFALKGGNFNGNEYAAQALDNGAAYAVIDEAIYQKDERFILVEDGLKALQDLAAFHRKQLRIPILAITGSNGKTTTKELLFSVLKQAFDVFATHGNLNNHIGVPLSLLSITKEHEFAIIEMGANHPKEIEFLAGIAQPSHGLITNIGKAHLEGFGSIEGVFTSKTELFDYLNQTAGEIFLFEDDPFLKDYKAKKEIRYGVEPFSVKPIEGQTLSFSLQLEGEQLSISTDLVGSYNLPNALAAAVVGKHFGLSNDQIKKGLEEYVPQNNRSQLTDTGRNQLIVDCYNANPSSMQLALKHFAQKDQANKLAVLGDMLELGSYSKEEHLKIVELLRAHSLKALLVGAEFAQVDQDDFEVFESVTQVQELLKTNGVKDHLILLKGSRGIALEKLVECL